MVARWTWRALVGCVALAAAPIPLASAQIMQANDIHYSIEPNNGLNDGTLSARVGISYRSLTTSQNYAKFEQLAVFGVPCTDPTFGRFVADLRTLQAAAAAYPPLPIVYMAPTMGTGAPQDSWENVLLTGCPSLSAGGAAPDSPAAEYSQVMSYAGLSIPGVDIEQLGLNARNVAPLTASVRGYVQALGQASIGTGQPWAWFSGNWVAYPRAGQMASGLFTPEIVSGLGRVTWMDLHQLYLSNGAAAYRQQVASLLALTGRERTVVQIGLNCMAGTAYAQTWSQSINDAEAMILLAYAEGVRNFNIFVPLAGIGTPQWTVFYSWLPTFSAFFPATVNMPVTPTRAGGKSYVYCLPE